MPKAKRQRSIKNVVLLLIVTSITVFTVIFVAIFYYAMPGMLREAEESYLREQLDYVNGLLQDAISNTHYMAYDIGIWDESVRFATGDYADYIVDTWADTSLLDTYQFNFVIMVDAAGNDLYTEYYDYRNGTHIPPYGEGFSAYIDEAMGEPVRARYAGLDTAPPDAEDMGLGGILFFEGEAYLAATMPIMHSNRQGGVYGAVTLGHRLDNAYFQAITHLDTTSFEVLPHDRIAYYDTRIQREYNMAYTQIPLSDISGNPALLSMRDTRRIYNDGWQTIIYTTLTMLAAIILLGVTLYLIVRRFVVKPIHALSADIAYTGISTSQLQAKSYGGSLELYSLCGSINEMLARIKSTNITREVLQNLLNGVDALLFATNPDTHEILFINDVMRKQFNLTNDVIGDKCYKHLHTHQDVPCDFCPIPKLKKNPDKAITWETTNAVSGLCYRSTDSLIKWPGLKYAHLQFALDITGAKSAESSMLRSMQQEALMSSISQSFLALEKIDTLIYGALKMTGEFMGVSELVIAKIDIRNGAIGYAYGWYGEQNRAKTPGAAPLAFETGMMLYDEFVTKKRPAVVCRNTEDFPNFRFLSDTGVKSFITVPLMVFGELWGFLSADDCAGPRAWSISDEQLVLTIGSIISGVIARNGTEEDLARMSNLVNSSPQFISYADEKGNFIYCNPSSLQILGYTAEELVGNSMRMLTDETTYEYMINGLIPRIIQSGKLDFELTLRCKNGDERVMSFSSFKTGADMMGIGSIASDITEKKRLEQDLINAKELAEESSRAKSDFLSRMSHEMRTPMGAIIGMTSIAKASPAIEKKEYCLDKIQEASSHLLGVINDILDMSKIEAKKFEFAHTEFNFEKMLMRVVDVNNFRIDEKKQTLNVHIDPRIPRFLIADEQRLAQVVTNLVSNAVKFTPENGLLSITADCVAQTEDSCTLRVEVSDSGIGISGEQQRRLFRSFEQADGGISRKFGGTGLGLAISKNIIDLMNGEIYVKSEVDKGSTFGFVITVKIGSAGRKNLLAPGVKWENLRLMVVDDSPDVLEYFKSITDSINIKCDTANGADEARALIESNTGLPYNIIFIDYRMPGMNGIELARTIKDDFCSDTAVIMISVGEWSEIEAEANAAGIDRFLPKPLFPSMIVDCINECLGVNTLTETPELAHTHTEQFSGCKILLAEDIEINREIVISLLSDTGVLIDCAENGRRALEMFRENSCAYDMIFMDIHMPEMDGYEATRHIRALPVPRAKTVPIVAMTANVFREDVEKCLAAGMNGHIGKPLDLDEMFGMMRRYLPG
ncbi:MAG: response regulator [Clostridiales bacterium]|jgi:PAS domain S-box-containing protein|nr:response regulator [Clostridiales bacterium]